MSLCYSNGLLYLRFVLPTALGHFRQAATDFSKSRKEDFVVALLDFIKTSKFAGVLFLSGIDVLNRSDAQMMYVLFIIVPTVGLDFPHSESGLRHTRLCPKMVLRLSRDHWPVSRLSKYPPLPHQSVNISSCKLKTMKGPFHSFRAGGSPAAFLSQCLLAGQPQRRQSFSLLWKVTIAPTQIR